MTEPARAAGSFAVDPWNPGYGMALGDDIDGAGRRENRYDDSEGPA